MAPAVLLGLGLLTGDVGLHLESWSDVEIEQAVEVADLLADAIHEHTGRDVVVDDPLSPSCRVRDPCAAAVRARTRAADLVFVRLYRGATRTRIVAELSPSGRRAEHDLLDARARWPEAAASIARALFEPRSRAPALEPRAPAPPTAPRARIAPWVSAGLTLGATAIGVGFGASSRAAERSILQDTLPPPEFEARLGRMRSHGVAANALFVTATVGAVVTIVLFLWDP